MLYTILKIKPRHHILTFSLESSPGYFGSEFKPTKKGFNGFLTDFTLRLYSLECIVDLLLLDKDRMSNMI